MASPQKIQLSEESLGTLLLDLEKKKSSVELTITSALGPAGLSVRAGKLVDASFGDLTGLDAARTLLALKEGECTVSFRRSDRPGPLDKDLSDLIKGSTRAGIAKDFDRQRPRGTLSMGTRIPLTDVTKKTLQSRVPSQAHLPAANASASLSQTVPGHRPVPARLRQGYELKPSSTGYSSVPPPAHAEEHVPLPRALRRTDPLPNFEGTPAIESTLSVGSVPINHITSLKDSAAISQNGDSLDAPSVFPIEDAVGDLSDLPPDSPGSDFGPRALGFKVDLDQEIFDAAEGQLSESEMPLPSARLSMEALHQLEELNEAVASSRRLDATAHAPSEIKTSSRNAPPTPRPLTEDELRDIAPLELPPLELSSRPSWAPPSAPASSTKDPASEAPPSSSSEQSYTASQAFTSQVPGSVPDPGDLPGKSNEPTGPSNLPRVGRYEVLSRLKRGGMGSVYMCRLSTAAGFRRLFAMKVLHGHLATQKNAIDSFFHEARVLGGLHHRNIVNIADVGTPEQPFIVLDYVEGGSLAEVYRATRKRPRDPAVILRIVLDALSGLDAAHQATDELGNHLSLVHCDVTPHNLLVGIDGTCRLTDFGIARTGVSDPIKEITRGKPGYLAPERILKKPSDHRSDLFSMGVVLYTGLTGKEPFSGKTAEDTMRNVLNQSLLPPSQVGSLPPSSLDLLCMKALARDPAERFQSANEMADQLRQIARRDGLLAPSADVATWVRDSLGPTLKARRVASMRGSATVDEQAHWNTMPPPGVSPAQAPNNGQRSSGPPPSSANNNSSSAPPSSRAYGDHTQILDDAANSASSSGRGFIFYLLITLVMLALVSEVLQPGSITSLLGTPSKPESTPAEKAPTTQGTTDDRAEPPALEEDDLDRIVIPEIVPQRGKP